MKKKSLILFCIFASAFAQAESAFKIGKPDAYSREFKIFRNLGDDRHQYNKSYSEPYRKFRDVDGCAEFFKKPVVFSAGKSADKDWPFIHPIANCPWADVALNAPTYAIEFNTPKSAASKKDWYFKVSFTDAAPYMGIGFKLLLNGKTAGEFNKLYEPSNSPSSLAYFPNSWGVPSRAISVNIDSSLFKTDGTKNILELVPVFDKKTTAKLWVTYDWLELSDSPDFPQIPDYRGKLVGEAIKAMGTEEVVFATRGDGRSPHWHETFGKTVSVNTGNPDIDKFFDQELFSRMGGKLVIYNLKTGAYRYLINDPKGCVRDPQVSYDGKKILFSYRKGDEDYFHLYQIDADGKNLTKLPIAGDWNDIEPCYMPNGDIVFASDRMNRTVQCYHMPVPNIHRWFKKENVVRCITVLPDIDTRPLLIPDGRILYTRWDYNHRSQVSYHNIWVVNPDGSNEMQYFGTFQPSGLYLSPRFIPNTEDLLCTLAPLHGMKDHRGNIARIKGKFPSTDVYAFEIVNGDNSPRYHDPYPLKNGLILATDAQRIVVMGDAGQVFNNFKLPDDLLASDAKVHYNVPTKPGGTPPLCKVIIRNVQPLAPRQPEAVINDVVDFKQNTAKVFLKDIYASPKMSGVKKGAVKKLMIVQVLPKPVQYGGSLPLHLQGGFMLEKVWGTVDVNPDGSAYFEVPVRTALAFVALDENGKSIKRMHDTAGFAPATETTCVGCHESRLTGIDNPQKLPLSKISKIDGVPEVIDYLRDIQPLLDKYCVECHSPQKPCDGIILTGDIGVNHIISRYMLANKAQVVTGNNQWGNLPPYAFGSGASELVNKAAGGHYNEKFSAKEMALLNAWLDIGAPQLGTFAGDHSGFLHVTFFKGQDAREKHFPAELKAINEVINVACGKCHKDPKGKPYAFHGGSGEILRVPDGNGGVKNSKFVREEFYNMSNPEDSIVLVLPLAKDAGGLAKAEGGAHPIVFKDKNDHEYKKLLGALTKIADNLKNTSPFINSPKFKHSIGYVRIMQKCGILPQNYDMNTVVDPFEADKKYFEWQEKNIEKKF